MAIKIKDEYTNVDNTDPNFPNGKFKNTTTAVSLDGTPFEKAWSNDFYGFFSKLLDETGIIPSGVPDNIANSDYFDALKTLFGKDPEFYGAVGDGVTDDTTAIEAFIASATAGETLTFGHNKTYLITDEIIVPVNVSLNLGGSKLLFKVTGAVRNLVIGSHGFVVNGTIENEGSTPSGDIDKQAPINIGDLASGVGKNKVILSDLIIKGNRPDGSGIIVAGDCDNIIISNVYFPDSSTLAYPILVNWGNLTDPASGTTHPRNIVISNIKFGTMTNQLATGAGVTVSGAYNVNINNVVAASHEWGSGLLSITAGTYGNLHATFIMKERITKGITIKNCSSTATLGASNFISIDCLGALAPAKLYAPNIQNCHCKGSYGSDGISVTNAFGGKIEDCNIWNFNNGCVVGDGVANLNIRGGEYHDNASVGVILSGNISPPENCTIEEAYVHSNKNSGTGHPGILFDECKYCCAKGNILGLTGETQVHGIWVNITAIGAVIIENHCQASHGVAYNIGDTTSYDVCNTFLNNTIVSGVGYHAGMRPQIISTLGLGGNFGTDPPIRSAIGSEAPTSGTWNAGDIVYDQSPSAGGYLGWICTAGGAPGTWKTFGNISL